MKPNEIFSLHKLHLIINQSTCAFFFDEEIKRMKKKLDLQQQHACFPSGWIAQWRDSKVSGRSPVSCCCNESPTLNMIETMRYNFDPIVCRCWINSLKEMFYWNQTIRLPITSCYTFSPIINFPIFPIIFHAISSPFSLISLSITTTI